MDTNFLKELFPLVKEGAPLLASSLFGPAGGMVVSLIESAFGDTKGDNLITAINQDPNSQATLLSLQNQHLEALSQLDNSDRANARSYSSNYHWILPILTLISLLGFFLMGYLVLNSNIDDSEHHILLLIVGTLIGSYNQIFAYYFGSSHAQYLQQVNTK